MQEDPSTLDKPIPLCSAFLAFLDGPCTERAAWIEKDGPSVEERVPLRKEFQLPGIRNLVDRNLFDTLLG